MSEFIDKARLTIKAGGYGIGPAAALADPMLLPRVQTFRRQFGARMMAFDKAKAARKIPGGEYFVSRKIDGEFTVLIYDGKTVFTVNPGGTVRTGLPFMDEAAKLLKKAKVKNAMIAGELHVRRPDGKRARVHDVSRVARNPESADDLQTLCFAVFDAVEIDGEPVTGTYAETWGKLSKWFDGGDLVRPVETVSGEKAADVVKQFEEWVEEEGSEGVVARSDTGGVFKVKPRHTIDVAVIGFTEGVDDRSGLLHDLLLAVMRADGAFHIIGRVGGGFSDEERVNFLSDLKDLVVESEYAEVNSDRVAYQMVRPDWVIEISCLDLVSQTTRGGSIDRMVLHWNADGKQWETVRRLPLVSVISPQFVRIRDDKKVHQDDLSLQQLTDLVEIDKADKTAEDLSLPKSDLLRREVRVKELKGNTMVRKLMMWKTNKEEQSDEYPAFVLYLTDFSPNRADPLKREIRVSNDQGQLNGMWEALEKKYFVSGWKEPE